MIAPAAGRLWRGVGWWRILLRKLAMNLPPTPANSLQCVRQRANDRHIQRIAIKVGGELKPISDYAITVTALTLVP